MRVLITTSEWPSHYFPMVPLAWALLAAGHDVRVACAPSQVPYVVGAGLTPQPVMDGPDPMFKTRLGRYRAVVAMGGTEPLLHPVTGQPMDGPADFDLAAYTAAHREGNLALMRRSCDQVVAFARRWAPDLVLFDPQNVEGVLAARVLGIPAVCHLFSMVGTHETEPGLNVVLEDHSDSFARYDQPEMSADLIDHVIDPAPGAVRPMIDVPVLPVRYMPYNGPGGVPEWAEEPRKARVLIAWGTYLRAVYGDAGARAPMLLEALADQDVEVVIAAAEADRADLGTLPANARVLDQWCPLRLLLPHCDAVIHYGSAGAALTSAALGVPQLALPFAPEQAMNAQRLAASGALLVEDGFTIHKVVVADRVTTLLGDPSYRAAAVALRADAQTRPTPADLVDTLAKVAAQ